MADRLRLSTPHRSPTRAVPAVSSIRYQQQLSTSLETGVPVEVWTPHQVARGRLLQSPGRTRSPLISPSPVRVATKTGLPPSRTITPARTFVSGSSPPRTLFVPTSEKHQSLLPTQHAVLAGPPVQVRTTLPSRLSASLASSSPAAGTITMPSRQSSGPQRPAFRVLRLASPVLAPSHHSMQIPSVMPTALAPPHSNSSGLPASRVNAGPFPSGSSSASKPPAERGQELQLDPPERASCFVEQAPSHEGDIQPLEGKLQQEEQQVPELQDELTQSQEREHTPVQDMLDVHCTELHRQGDQASEKASKDEAVGSAVGGSRIPTCSCSELWPSCKVSGCAPLTLLHSKIMDFFSFKDLKEETEQFEETVTFLASVPIFKKQLPSSELPKVAMHLQETKFTPGSKVVSQGALNTTFYMIYSGEASVQFTDADGEDHVGAVLSAGDWIGGQALVTSRPSPVTVVAQGPEDLVTYSMAKDVFEASGLKGRLHFPKRPAMHIKLDTPEDELAPVSPCRRKSGNNLSALEEGQEHLILAAIRKNPNLRAFCEETSTVNETSEALRHTVCKAKRRVIPKGSTAAEFGELGDEFFIIQDGSFEVVVDESASASSKRSAESAASAFSMAERIRRKQAFLTMLLKRPVFTRAQSTVMKSSEGNTDRTTMRATRSERKFCADATKEAVKATLERGSMQLFHDFIQKGVAAADHAVKRASEGISSRANGRRRTRRLSLDSVMGDRTQSCDSRDTDEADTQVLSILKSGDSFGELSLLYNMRREATFRALEDSIVWVINRKIFKDFTGSGSGRRRLKEHCALLDEVDSLSPLLKSQRMELAALARETVHFAPSQRVLYADKERRHPQWYVVQSGKAILSQCNGDKRRILAECERGEHFGERSLLRARKTGGTCHSDVDVDAGPEGLVCLTFDGELICNLFTSLSDDDASELPSVDCDAQEWERWKSARKSKRSCQVHLPSLREIQRLGVGAFGKVFLVEDGSKNQYALKRVSKGHATRTGTRTVLCWERDLMNMLDSDFVVRLYKTYRDSQYIYFLLEAALGGNLYNAMCQHTSVFSDDEPRGSSSAFYAACVLAALEHLHERKIIYRDMKPENIMLNTGGYGKICDMGLARFVVGKTNTQAGTPDYMAPEIIDPPHWHDSSADWWSLGVLVFEMLNQQLPFSDEDLEDTGARLLAIRRSQEQMNLPYSRTCPQYGRSLVMNLLKKLPRRLGVQGGAKEVREHGFFKSLDFDALHAQMLPSPLQRPWQQSPTSASMSSPWHRDGEPDSDDELFVHYEADGSNWDKDFHCDS
eukprot:TRINITY_DN3098_c0_g2_i1.p1 TRINITY_DN3098_c0_g2~~TRINITY_DN3098_c0_g2_i1.p1  ORF type:complete len:1297 (+),score=172.36 TRINITY_DN3098_c0_g2_i1:90-3980(+)